MSYGLERQHKERKLIFELEMQNKLYYLANVNKLVNYSNSRQTKQGSSNLIAEGRFQECGRVRPDKTAEIKIPSKFEEWLHEKTYSEENFKL